MLSRFGVAAVAIVAGCLTAVASQMSLAELAKFGLKATRINLYTSPVTLSELLTRSDLVVLGNVRSLTSYEIKDEEHIATDCVVELYDVIVERDGKYRQAGDVVTVLRRGGRLVLGDDTFVAEETGFPAFEVGEQYILFLRHDAYRNALMVVSSGQGAFRVGSDGIARQVRHIHGDTPEERTVLDRSVSELRNLILASAALR